MAFRKLKELDNKKAIIMGGFVIAGLTGLSMSATPLVTAYLGTSTPFLLAAMLLNPLVSFAAALCFPMVFLQILKLFKVWPMHDRPRFSWRFKDLMADLSAALKNFNQYLPIKKFAIIHGFLSAGGIAYTLSVSPFMYAAFGVSAATFIAALLLNSALKLSALLFLPGLYLQMLKKWQVWPMKQARTPVSFKVEAIFADTLLALHSFDWQILNWLSDLLLSKFFPHINEAYDMLQHKQAPKEGGWWNKTKWGAAEFAKISGNFLVTLFSDKPMHKLIGTNAKNISSTLMSIALREQIHILAYQTQHQARLARLPHHAREEEITNERATYVLNLFASADNHQLGFFESIGYGAYQELASSQEANQERAHLNLFS